jgi:hypothetical protein
MDMNNKDIMDQIKCVFDKLLNQDMIPSDEYEDDDDYKEVDESYEELDDEDPLKKGFQVIIVSKDIKDPFKNEER